MRDSARPYTADVDLATLRTFIREERDRRHWSLDDLAERSGLNRSAVHEIETGDSSKTQFVSIVKLAAGFGDSLVEFLTRAARSAGTLGASSSEPQVAGTPLHGSTTPRTTSAGTSSGDYPTAEAILIQLGHIAEILEKLVSVVEESRRQDAATRRRPSARAQGRRKTG